MSVEEQSDQGRMKARDLGTLAAFSLIYAVTSLFQAFQIMRLLGIGHKDC